MSIEQTNNSSNNSTMNNNNSNTIDHREPEEDRSSQRSAGSSSPCTTTGNGRRSPSSPGRTRRGGRGGRNKRNNNNNGNNNSNTNNRSHSPSSPGSTVSPTHLAKYSKSNPNAPPSPPHDAPMTKKDIYFALDCEMVGVGPTGTESALARVVIVNYDEEIVLDKFVKVDQPVTDYRTFVSGVTASDLESPDALTFAECQKLVRKVLHGKILIGHGLTSDLTVMDISHPWCDIRDTARYAPFMRKVHSKDTNTTVLMPQKLRDLVWDKCGMQIQVLGKSHDPREDALAALNLYKAVRTEWEMDLIKQVKAARAMEDDCVRRAHRQKAAAVQRRQYHQQQQFVHQQQQQAPVSPPRSVYATKPVSSVHSGRALSPQMMSVNAPLMGTPTPPPPASMHPRQHRGYAPTPEHQGRQLVPPGVPSPPAPPSTLPSAALPMIPPLTLPPMQHGYGSGQMMGMGMGMDMGVPQNYHRHQAQQPPQPQFYPRHRLPARA
mmetsp:Transcript_17028/g.36938  ORF Transcript_17028/g.36938 Transcript_17028/m.36938 type:complete len:491 (+) Transcript_17028:369-1841(+)